MKWNQQKNQLLKDLRRFGLNPKEWQFQKGLQGPSQPQILTHKKDRDFSILGIPKLDDIQSQWGQITVLSI